MEPFECKTVTWNSDDVACMLEQVNELGAEGWEVCAQGTAKTGSEVIGS